MKRIHENIFDPENAFFQNSFFPRDKREIMDNDDSYALNAFLSSVLDRGMTAEQLLRSTTDAEGDKLDKSRFFDVCESQLRLMNYDREQLWRVFDAIDENHDGMIDALEMKRILKNGVSNLLKMTSKRSFLARKESMQEKNTRLVALVAHNHMKAPLLHFVTKHINFFKTVNIVTTGSTGSVLENNLGLKIKHKVASGPLGGDQEIGSLVTNDEVAAAFFFIDPLSAHPHDADIKALVRIMDVHNIACATNPITGSALIAAFQSNIGNFRNCLYVDHSRDESEVVLTYKMHQQTVIKDTKE